MMFKKISILLTLFIFGIVTQGWPDSVKSMNNSANQLTIIKMDENGVTLKKRIKPSKESLKTSTKSKAEFPPIMSYSDYGAIRETVKIDVNFLKVPEEKKKSRLMDSLDKVIYSYQFPLDAWRDKFLTFQEVTKTQSSNSDFSQLNWRSYPNENKYAEEGRILQTFKLLEHKKEELFKGIFMRFRFSFDPMRGHIGLEINVTPFSEKGSVFIISL